MLTKQEKSLLKNQLAKLRKAKKLAFDNKREFLKSENNVENKRLPSTTLQTIATHGLKGANHKKLHFIK